MSAKVTRTLWAGVTIGVAFLIANLVLSIVNTRQLREESISILRSNELLLALDNVLKLVVDAETGQRGFVITGQAEYLAPYRSAVGSIQNQMDQLQALIAGDPAQQSLMADVRRRPYRGKLRWHSPFSGASFWPMALRPGFSTSGTTTRSTL